MYDKYNYYDEDAYLEGYCDALLEMEDYYDIDDYDEDILLEEYMIALIENNKMNRARRNKSSARGTRSFENIKNITPKKNNNVMKFRANGERFELPLKSAKSRRNYTFQKGRYIPSSPKYITRHDDDDGKKSKFTSLTTEYNKSNIPRPTKTTGRKSSYANIGSFDSNGNLNFDDNRRYTEFEMNRVKYHK